MTRAEREARGVHRREQRAGAWSRRDASVRVSQANGHSFIEKTIEILRYLAHTRNVPMPH